MADPSAGATFTRCPRCGEPHMNGNLTLIPFAKPVTVGDTFLIDLTHFATCPVTNEPILFWGVDFDADDDEGFHCG